nr:hypothetical protein [Suid alphaherpesvirus 1]
MEFEDGRGATVVRGEPGGSSGPRTLRAHAPLAHHTPPHTAEVGRERAPPLHDPARPGPDALAPPQHPLSPPASPRSLRAIAHTTPARMLGFFTRRTPWAADGTVSRRPPCACVGLSRPRVSAWLFCWSGCEKGTLMRPPLQRSSSAARSSTTTTSLFSPALPHRPPPAIARAPSPLPHPRPLSPHRHPTPSPTPPSTLTPHRVASALTHAYMHTRPSLLGAPAAGPSQPSPPPSHPSAALLSFSPSPSPSHPRSPLFPISPLPPPSTLIDGLLRHHHHQPPITISRRRPDGDPRCSRGARSHSQPGGFDGRPRGVDGDGRSGVIVCYQTAPPSPCPSSTSRRPAPRGAGAAGGWVGDRAGGRVWTGGGGGVPAPLPPLSSPLPYPLSVPTRRAGARQGAYRPAYQAG